MGIGPSTQSAGECARDAPPDNIWANSGDHEFWNRGTTAIFDIHILNLYAGSYLLMTPEKVLAKTDKENKDKYLQICLERRHNFTPLVFSSDLIPGV